MTPYYKDSYVTIFNNDWRDVIDIISFEVVISDPPYGRKATTKWGGKYDSFNIYGDNSTQERDDLISRISCPFILFGSPFIGKPKCKATLIWDKGGNSGMGDLLFPWKPDYEEIYINGEGFCGPRTSSIIRVINDNSSNRSHPTEKPTSLMISLIQKCPSWAILDPFMGSGSTLRAAKDLQRNAIGIEIEEKYCEIAAKRMSQEPIRYRISSVQKQMDIIDIHEKQEGGKNG